MRRSCPDSGHSVASTPHISCEASHKQYQTKHSHEKPLGWEVRVPAWEGIKQRYKGRAEAYNRV